MYYESWKYLLKRKKKQSGRVAYDVLEKPITNSFCVVGILLLIVLTISATIVLWSKHLDADLYAKLSHALVHRHHIQSFKADLDPEKVISCYYNTPNYSEPHQLLPSDIHPHLCTHINVAFATIKDKNISLDDSQKVTLEKILKLKTQNPKLKVLLSIGGASNDEGFPDMIVDHASRKIFIKSVKYVLQQYQLDGIDLDWEFPVVHDTQTNEISEKKGNRERQHFSQLLREIRKEYEREKKNYLLTIAVAAPESIVDIAYDVDQLNLYVDYVNIMTYDFHFFSKYTPFTGLNSPLYSHPTDHFYLSTLNINYTVHMYMDKGLDKSKIVVGIPTYGHTYTLVNSENPTIGSPASGYGSLGDRGFVIYPVICAYLSNHTTEVNVMEDSAAMVPYLYRNQEWVSFDDTKSVMEKAKYIKENELRGAMIYSLGADDHEGLCRGSLGTKKKFPLLQSVKSVLVSDNISDLELIS